MPLHVNLDPLKRYFFGWVQSGVSKLETLTEANFYGSLRKNFFAKLGGFMKLGVFDAAAPGLSCTWRLFRSVWPTLHVRSQLRILFFFPGASLAQAALRSGVIPAG